MEMYSVNWRRAMQLKLTQVFSLPDFVTFLSSLPPFPYSLPHFHYIPYSLPCLVTSVSLAGLWILHRHLKQPADISPFSKLTGVHQWVRCVQSIKNTTWSFIALLKCCIMLRGLCSVYHKRSNLPLNQDRGISSALSRRWEWTTRSWYGLGLQCCEPLDVTRRQPKRLVQNQKGNH